jgi:hypothetical protein
LKKELGLKSNAKSGEIGKSLIPYLSEKLDIRKKGNSSYYLCLAQPLDEIVFHVLNSKDGETAGQLGRRVPLKKNELQESINVLVDKGLIKIKLNKTLLPCVYRVSAEVPTCPPPASQKKEEPRTEEPKTREIRTAEQFRAAFQELEQGKIFVDIHALRRRLNWSREEFDTMLQKLRNDGRIHLYAGDTSTMTPDEIKDGFVDKNGFHMGSITWNQ